MRRLVALALVAGCGAPADTPTAEPEAPPPADPAPAQPQSIPATASFVSVEPSPARATGGDAIRIAYASVHVRIEGGVARTTVDDVLVNDRPGPVEATFTFPLPDDATVIDFAHWQDGKRIAAALTDKDTARQRLATAAAAGKAASLGETSDRMFQMKLATLPGNSQRRVQLVYTQTIQSLGGERTWALPARHYTDQVPTHLDLAVELTADRELTQPRELNHDDVRVARSGPRHATVYLARSRRPLGNDVVVRWSEPTADLELAGRAARRVKGEPAYVTARFGFERDPDAATRDPMRVVLVLDRSLSMAGEPLARARRLATGVLERLDPRDSVALVAFDAGVHAIEMAPATIAHRQRIEAELGASVASGGSNLAAALDEATTLLAGQRHGVVVLMTDGQPTVGDGVEHDLPAAKAKDLAGARVVIAHFNYPSRQAALEQLFPGARLHYVPDGRAGDRTVDSLVRLAVAPAIEDLVIAVDGTIGETQGVVPATLAMGQDVRLAMRADGPVTLLIRGKLRGKPIELAHEIAVPAAPDAAGDALAIEWARLRLADLERRYRAGETRLASEIRSLGTDYRLATLFTSFIADDDSLSPDRIMPGDPEIRIRASRSLERVYAVLPWGEIVDCAWDAAEQLWLGRFLVPRATREGLYRVRVYTRSQDRIALRGTLLYRVDHTAPKFTLDATYDRGVLRLRATPVSGVYESRTGDQIRDDRVDLKRAVVHVGGSDIELVRAGDVWIAERVVALRGSVRLSLVTTDYAGNAATATTQLELAP
jgi:Ca-activated chloride channel homolog